MTESESEVPIDLSNLYAIAGGDASFVSMLLMKMCAALPEAYTKMEAAVAEKDYPTLKSAAHKAKSTFAYLGLDDMKDRLKDIEHHCMDGTELDDLPRQVEEAVALGRRILAGLNLELEKLS
jgi:HPt (histidine-containing phosphotransfer) domain-containing protein